MKNLYESLLDDFDILYSNQNKQLCDQWVKDNIKGDYKAVILKNGNIKLRGNAIIKDFQDDYFPFQIVAVNGNLTIEKCPNITTIKNLFADPMIIDGNLSINNCPKLNTLEGCPHFIQGAFSLVGNKSLKSLEGCPDIVFGSIYIMKNGKKFSTDTIKKSIECSQRIVCSINNDLLEGLINEELNEPHLLELVDRMKKLNLKPSELFSKYPIEWDLLDSTNSIEYPRIDSKAETDARNIIAARGGKSGIILLIDYDGNYSYIITSSKSMLSLKHERDPKTGQYVMWDDNIQSTLLMNYVKDARSMVIITWKEDTLDARWKKRNKRINARQGMIINTPEEYEKIAKANRERYKKLAAQNRANGVEKEFEKIDKDIDIIIEKVMKLSRDLRKNFNSNNNNTNFHWDIEKIDELNRHIYDQKVFMGYNKSGNYDDMYRGDNGLLYLYSQFTQTYLKVKQNGDSYYEKRSADYKKELLDKIKFLKKELNL